MTKGSEALGLSVCWEDGMLRFFDPVAESYLRSHDEAEARVAELEAELRRLPGEESHRFAGPYPQFDATIYPILLHPTDLSIPERSP